MLQDFKDRQKILTEQILKSYHRWVQKSLSSQTIQQPTEKKRKDKLFQKLLQTSL